MQRYLENVLGGRRSLAASDGRVAFHRPAGFVLIVVVVIDPSDFFWIDCDADDEDN